MKMPFIKFLVKGVLEFPKYHSLLSLNLVSQQNSMLRPYLRINDTLVKECKEINLFLPDF